MTFVKSRWVDLVILLILITSAWLRVVSYGDLRLSSANPETGSYVQGAKAPLFSWKIFAGKRLFTTNLIYKFAADAENCPVAKYSAPAAGKEKQRNLQPCFDKIALLQNIISIFGWVFLAWMTARWLKTPLARISSALLILAFGFTPQIAEWDSILGPETLSLSLFAISLALLMELAFRIAAAEKPFSSWSERALFAGWLVIFILWVFVRDVHLYAIPLTLMVIAPLLLVKKLSGTKHIAAALLILSAFFVVGYLSARDSLRATYYPVVNAVDFYILPYPQRAEFFKQFDMPERTSPGYQAWADANASKAYGLFLATHPGFVVSTLWEYMDHFTQDFVQPYFKKGVQNRDLLIRIGEFIHPQSASVFLIDILLLLALFNLALRYRSASTMAWAWMAALFILIAAITLFLSFFGDIYGTRRHIMPSVEMFRLYLWVFLMPFLDQLSAGRN
jgi:hypothetical protein